MMMLAGFVRITHDAGTRGKSRATTGGKPHAELSEGVVSVNPVTGFQLIRGVDIGKRLGDLHCTARVSHCDEHESLV